MIERTFTNWSWLCVTPFLLFFAGCETQTALKTKSKKVDTAAKTAAAEVTIPEDNIGVADRVGLIPILPEKPFDYTTIRAPRQIASQLSETDATPSDNPITDEGATLGRVLFYDKHLSIDDTIACASCHQQQHAFADPNAFSAGLDGALTKRNAMGLSNLRFTNLKGHPAGLFWDERAVTLEVQALLPIQDEIEMGMELSQLETKLARLSYYPTLFESAFGSPEITSERIARAIAQFVRSMISLNSKFDRAAVVASTSDYMEDFGEFTDEENLGKSLFVNGVDGVAEIGCAHCHVPPTFGMPKSFNNGLELKYKDQGLGAREEPLNDPFTPSNDGKFKAPSLRNIELTAPYMHDGRFATLKQVIEHYSSGVHPHENVGLAFNENAGSGQKTSGFNLTEEQKAALVAFLKTLTDDQFVSDPRFSDPFQSDSPDLVHDEDDQSSNLAETLQALVEEFEEQGGARSFAPRFIELAESNPGHPAAFDALHWLVKNVKGRAETTQSLEMLAEHHVDNQKLASALTDVVAARSTAAEKLLRTTIENSPHEEIRAQACSSLASLLENETRIVQELKQQPERAPRVLQYYGKQYGAYLAELDTDQLEAAREQVYEQMLNTFGDVAGEDETLGEFATKALFKLRHLSVGKLAPDIDGIDIFGENFKLSDYRGKVVMLSFWGHW